MPAIRRASSRQALLVDAPHRVDGIGLLRALVRAVAFDSRKAQRQSARILRALLQIVERDLDYQLGTHLHPPIIATGRALYEFLGLPCERRIGQSLERLAQHDEATGGRIESTEVQVGEPAPPAAVPPFGREHHQVERARALHLEPARAAPPGL